MTGSAKVGLLDGSAGFRNLDDGPLEQHYPHPHAPDPELERKVQAVPAKRKRDLADPKYNVLNAAAWHAYAGHLSNRIIDLEAFFGPLNDLLDSFRAMAREADNAVELTSILEKVEAYELDANRYVGKLRELSDAMDGELTWYSDEIYREWGHVEAEQGNDGDHVATSE